jgi:hypothetical protein
MLPQEYFLIEEGIFGGIDKLKIDSENFVIISVELDIDYLSRLQIEGLQKDNDKWFYKGMEIIEIDNSQNELISPSIFVLKREDLPNMIFEEIESQIVKKYQLEKIDDTYNIYTGLNDLNKPENETIKKEVEQQKNQVDLSKSVLARVDINVKIQYKQNIDCVQLKVFFQYGDRGEVNKLEDIKRPPSWA